MQYQMPTCGGCRTCELACAFIFTGEFAPSQSVIHILEPTVGQGYAVTFVVPSGETVLPCRNCFNKATPACVQYCEKSSDLTRLIEQGLADEK